MVREQIALELILGFDESLLTEETINRCTAAFIDWNDGLFSFPLDLPGTGAQRWHYRSVGASPVHAASQFLKPPRLRTCPVSRQVLAR